MKPRIRQVWYGPLGDPRMWTSWQCAGENVIGHGSTPYLAWADWQGRLRSKACREVISLMFTDHTGLEGYGGFNENQS